MNEDVAVTGMGAVTPLGHDVASLWEGVLAGRSGVSALEQPWVEDLPVRIAGQVSLDMDAVFGRVQARRLDRTQQMALVAAREAWTQADLSDVDPERLAVVVGSGIGGIATLLETADVIRERGARAVSPFAVTKLIANGPAAAVGLEYGARAGVHAPVSACASGSEAVSLAFDLIRLGRADLVICGGTEAAVTGLTIAGFAAMRALSTRGGDPRQASRPFDKQRDGFVLGEGAGILVLESLAHAQSRRARVLGHVYGCGMTADSHHIVAPDPTGIGAARAIRLALQAAAVDPSDVVHVNAHATATPAGDAAESLAIRSALGAAADAAVVSATKSSTGHLLGASGAVEAILSILALRDLKAPPIANLDDPDDAIELDLARVVPRDLRPGGVALSTSFGFGGHDVALVLAAAS